MSFTRTLSLLGLARYEEVFLQELCDHRDTNLDVVLSESAVAEVLRELITCGEAVTVERVLGVVASRAPQVIAQPVNHISVAPVVLSVYDGLLHGGREVTA